MLTWLDRAGAVILQEGAVPLPPEATARLARNFALKANVLFMGDKVAIYLRRPDRPATP